MKVPSATYRLQMTPEMGGFSGAHALIPYLDALGVSDLYTSPILQARPGSTHGYDVTDPAQLNAELGTAADFDALTSSLAERSMGLIVDIVPNHMAAGVDNPWWRSVLEHGPASPFAGYFDIEWQPLPGMPADQIILPVLGKHYGDALEAGELVLDFSERGFGMRYYDHEIPLDPSSCAPLVLEVADAVRASRSEDGELGDEVRNLAETLAGLPRRTTRSPARRRRRLDTAARVRERLLELVNGSTSVADAIATVLAAYRGAPHQPGSLGRLDRLLSRQAYALRFWRTAGDEVNYRRFFDIGDLVGIRADQPEVFEATHRLILQFVWLGRITGLRVDHVDGLYDPEAYLHELARRTSRRPAAGEADLPDRPAGVVVADDGGTVAPASRGQGSVARRRGGRGGSAGSRPYVIVEKIQGPEEELPAAWAVQGTTGYDFLNTVAGLFVDPAGLRRLERIYASFLGSPLRSFADIAFESKQRVIRELFVGDVRNLEWRLIGLARRDRHGRDLTGRQLARAIEAVSACLGVYRTYIGTAPSEQDRLLIEEAVAEARRRYPAVDPTAFDFLRRVLLLDLPADAPAVLRQAWLAFVRRWQQLTGPVTAKGVEDTALYVYNPLTSVNEVGGDPALAVVGVPHFHERMLARQQRWPAALNATSTHDTKRGEDVRARLHVLSELPSAFGREVRIWARLNEPLKERVHGRPIPNRNHEWLLYQALLGAWPLDPAELPELVARLQEYAVKSAREGNADTSWLEPDDEVEQALRWFVRRILDPTPDNRFLPRLRAFHQRIGSWGAQNSLSQLLLKVAAPGVPDFYQGTELWSLTLVDPDNRRPVDFTRRMELLAECAGASESELLDVARNLLSNWCDGRIKLHLTARLLHFRQRHRRLFQEGKYIPLGLAGRWRDRVCAFARHSGGTWALAIAPRLAARLARPGAFALGEVWGRTRIQLPPGAPTGWRDVLTGEVVAAVGSHRAPHLMLADALRHLPVALLYGAEPASAGS